MRKFFILTFMVLSGLSAIAYDFESDGIYYNITSESNLTVEVTYPKNYSVGWYSTEYHCAYSGNIVVPEKVTNNGITYKVTGIGTWAFGTSPTSGLETYMNNLKSIQLPSTITIIGQCAFYKCKSINSLIIPSSVTNIGNDSFWCENCESTLFLSPNPPAVTTSGAIITGVANGLIHIPGEIWVTNKKAYLSWNRRTDEYWGGLVELCTPNESTFTYDGNNPIINWTNNIKGYSILVNDFFVQKNAGNYSVTVMIDYYKDNEMIFSAPVPYEYTINKAPLTIKANNANREYGDDNPSFTFTYLGFVNGENENEITVSPTVGTTATKTSNIGDYPITISGGSAANYEFIYESGVLTITKASLSAKVNDTMKIYGSQNPVFMLEYHGLKNNEIEPEWTTKPTFKTEATKTSSVGQYVVSAINGVAVNYDLEIDDGTLTVTPAQLTIKANDTTKKYYSDNPTFSYSCSGFVNEDDKNVLTLEPTLSTSATLSSNVGAYDIEVNGASSTNYSISYVNGTLTITPRILTTSVGNYERLYNEDNPTFDVKYDGFVGNENENVLITKATASTTATKTSDVGSYPINVTGGSADNYSFSYIPGTLTINKAEQTILWEQDMSSLKVGDQVELQAVASSGLPITYTMESNSFAEIYSAGNNKKYLDCKAEGQFIIRATQDGNYNYYSSIRINKTVTIGNGESSVKSLDNSMIRIQNISFGIRVLNVNVGDVIRIYSIDGILQKSVKAEEQITDIPLIKDKVYIVKAGGKIVKLGF